MERNHIGIIGTGLIGISMAVLLTGNGMNVTVLGISDESIKAGKTVYERYFSNLNKYNLVNSRQMEACSRLLNMTKSYKDLSECNFVIEAVVEDISVKSKVFRTLENDCSGCVIASMTSAISVNDLAEKVKRPENLLVAHPWNPPHLVPCVEIVKGEKTSDYALQMAVNIFKAAKREVVVLQKSVPGFIGNRLMHAMFREATYLVDNGIATAEDIDRILMYSFGPRYSSIGIFEHNDFVGLDMVQNISNYLYPDLNNSTKALAGLEQRVQKKEVGFKSAGKKGYLDWNKKNLDDFFARQEAPYLKFFNWELPE